jgi:hypothetical protein
MPFSISNNGPLSFVSPCGQPVVSENALSPEVYVTVSSWTCQKGCLTYVDHVRLLFADFLLFGECSNQMNSHVRVQAVGSVNDNADYEVCQSTLLFARL